MNVTNLHILYIRSLNSSTQRKVIVAYKYGFQQDFGFLLLRYGLSMLNQFPKNCTFFEFLEIRVSDAIPAMD